MCSYNKIIVFNTLYHTVSYNVYMILSSAEARDVKNQVSEHRAWHLRVSLIASSKYESSLYGEKQGGHKPGKHGKPGKLREFEKLSLSQGKLREI